MSTSNNSVITLYTTKPTIALTSLLYNKLYELINLSVTTLVDTTLVEYLKEDGFHISVECPNIMRLLEQFCIMKPSQSTTEQVMSHEANTVKDRFESKISPYTTDKLKIDSVNLEVLLKCNANMVSLDKTAARHIFYKKHLSVLMKSKSSIERSKTVKSLILKLKSTKTKTKVRESKAKIVEKEKKQSRTLDSYLVAAPSVHHVKKSSVAPQIDEVLRTTESNKKNEN